MKALGHIALMLLLERVEMNLDEEHQKQQEKAERRIEMAKKRSRKHPGFKSVQNKIAKKSGVSKKAAGAILASATRKASPAAKRKNPRLKRVK